MNMRRRLAATLGAAALALTIVVPATTASAAVPPVVGPNDWAVDGDQLWVYVPTSAADVLKVQYALGDQDLAGVEWGDGSAEESGGYFSAWVSDSGWLPPRAGFQQAPIDLFARRDPWKPYQVAVWGWDAEDNQSEKTVITIPPRVEDSTDPGPRADLDIRWVQDSSGPYLLAAVNPPYDSFYLVGINAGHHNTDWRNAVGTYAPPASGASVFGETCWGGWRKALPIGAPVTAWVVELNATQTRYSLHHVNTYNGYNAAPAIALTGPLSRSIGEQPAYFAHVQDPTGVGVGCAPVTFQTLGSNGTWTDATTIEAGLDGVARWTGPATPGARAVRAVTATAIAPSNAIAATLSLKLTGSTVSTATARPVYLATASQTTTVTGPAAGRAITFQTRVGTGTWVNAATVTTDAAGVARWSPSLLRGVQVRATLPGPVSSPVIGTLHRRSAAVALKAARVRAGKTTVLTATTSGAAVGTTVTVQRCAKATGSCRALATVRTSVGGKATLSVRAPARAGRSWYYRAVLTAVDALTPGVTTSRIRLRAR